MMILRHTLARALALATLPLALAAAPVQQPTPVHAQPNAQSPVLTVLQPGAQLTPPAGAANAPAGWVAVELPGPHDVYVENKDITKALDVSPGAALRTEPSTSAPVLATAAAGDPVEITGLRGRWTQLRLNRAVIGFSPTAAATTAASAPAPAPSTTAAAPAAAPRREAPPPAATPPAAAPTTPPPGPGRAVPMVNQADGGLAALPRLFEGRFVSTRRALRPRRPYEYALEDHTGERIAYVDISRLLLTDQIENYIGRHVSAYGTARAVPETKDIVVTVESLQLR